MLMFSRRTYFPIVTDERRYFARGKHWGAVLSAGPDVHFVGINRLFPYQISYLTVGAEPLVGSNFYTGMAVTHKIKGTLATNAAIQLLKPSLTKRALLKSIGPLDIDSVSIDPVIRLMLTARTTSGINQIQAIDADLLVRDRRPPNMQEQTRVSVG